MTTRSEKERQKAQQEKFQAILSNLLKDDDNKYCVDCDAKGPRWASWNLGIFLCIRCAGIHRNLGVHISKVKSVNLDTWSPEQIAMMMEVGNSRARAAYEANLPDNYRRPQANGALESFIRAKYEQKKYMAKEWVQPKPTIPKELLEDDKDKRKAKPKPTGQISLSSVPRVSSEPQMTSHSSKPSNPKPVQTVKASSPQQPTPAPPPKSSTTGDLIGLDAPTAVQNTSSSLLDDFMGSSAPSSSSQPVPQPNTGQVANGSLEANLFGETTSTEKTTNVSTKDSIMALFGGGQQTQQQFGVPASTCSYTSPYEEVGGVMSSTYNTNPFQTSLMFAYADPGGVYMSQQQQPPQQQPQMGVGMYNMQQPQQQQQMPQMNVQQGMYGNQMGMMGINQAQMGMGSMGTMPQGQMGMQQGMMGMPGAQMGMYGQQQQQQPQMQPMQFQQMHQQMTNMNLGQPQQMGMGWSGSQSSGHTLSTNLWQ
ncbi:stromal membrane-associated protein 1-like isoform X2 [Mercenaria mercenaria]|uniref:stromal membrane-associated protein 1-like isoform X2 n=1 Tax=Mercenaria mercenaria TaxID=6596 RepID=UPI00234E72D1|nr:stromal membrane-associated protein 1-like isoform X2 [Mercenaria mercenaria]